MTNLLIAKLVSGTTDERKFICENRIDLFALTYFSEFFQYPMAPFHGGFFKDLRAFEKNEIEEALWMGFKECAKTSDAKIGLAHMILYRKKKYALYGAYDKDNSEAALFDVVVQLQTNPKILHDFGSIYNESRSDDEKKLKKVTSFITATNIKVEAISTGESVRGKVFNTNRPDFYIYDDIENSKTRESAKITRKIIAHLDEARSGLGKGGSILYLGNYITESGVVNHLMEEISKNPRGVVRNIPAITNGKPSWPGKYVLKDIELLQSPEKISLESKRRSVGENTWREDYMNDPAGVAEPFFDRRRVDMDLARAEDPDEVTGEFRMYAKYDPSHRYALGADTAMGVGRDSCASIVMDFTQNPNMIVGCYDDNKIAPNVFAHEIKREGDLYGSCLVAPEVNNESGGACLNELKGIYRNIHRTRQSGKFANKATTKIGWTTNSSTKSDMFFSFRKDYQDGQIDIRDKKLLKEMRQYTKLDLGQDEDPETTRHFDLLTAACIAHKLKEFASYSIDTKRRARVQQQAYESPSIAIEERREVMSSRIDTSRRRSTFQQSTYESPSLDV